MTFVCMYVGWLLLIVILRPIVFIVLAMFKNVYIWLQAAALTSGLLTMGKQQGLGQSFGLAVGRRLARPLSCADSLLAMKIAFAGGRVLGELATPRLLRSRRCHSNGSTSCDHYAFFVIGPRLCTASVVAYQHVHNCSGHCV